MTKNQSRSVPKVDRQAAVRRPVQVRAAFLRLQRVAHQPNAGVAGGSGPNGLSAP